MRNIRNFSIIAHIDHGKSTLADRLIERCGGLESREMAAQVLDSMDIERERGITIKAQSVALEYLARDGQLYRLNFIDTPGHVDFSYEVSRSLAACEGALLVVDAAQERGGPKRLPIVTYGNQTQGLEVLPVHEQNRSVGRGARSGSISGDRRHHRASMTTQYSVRTSVPRPARASTNCWRLLVDGDVPPPQGDPDAPLQALIIDSWFDNYVGVVSLVRVVNGDTCSRQQDHDHVHAE